jgi:hypothetical protein
MVATPMVTMSSPKPGNFNLQWQHSLYNETNHSEGAKQLGDSVEASNPNTVGSD